MVAHRNKIGVERPGFGLDLDLDRLAEADRELTIRSSSTPIAVLTITNTDPHGLRIDDLRHVVPGP